MSSHKQHYITSSAMRYNEIADWLIMNPHKGNKRECAIRFDISQAWLSTVINTDAFRALMEMKQEALFTEVVVPVKEKLMGLADRGVERLGEVLDETTDERLVHDITKTSLSLLGFGASKATEVNINNNVQTNTVNVNADALADARARRTTHYQEKQIEDTSGTPALQDQSLPKGLSHDIESGMGETRDVRTLDVHSATTLHGTEKEGSGV